jgi:hypothetical protein
MRPVPVMKAELSSLMLDVNLRGAFLLTKGGSGIRDECKPLFTGRCKPGSY